jgi:hypothetical protein
LFVCFAENVFETEDSRFQPAASSYEINDSRRRNDGRNKHEKNVIWEKRTAKMNESQGFAQMNGDYGRAPSKTV